MIDWDDFISFNCIFLTKLIKLSICILPISYHQSGEIISYLKHVLSKFKVGNEIFAQSYTISDKMSYM